MSRARESESDLSGVRRRLTGWRRRHGGRGRRIPPTLWSAAVEVARAEGVDATVRALGLSRAGLERRLAPADEVASADPAVAPGDMHTAGRPRFVELDSFVLRGTRRVIVQLEDRDGSRLRVEADDASGVDVVAIARAFLERSR